ncbi:hypothetical protein CAPTEDRAFT_171260 [Capitella teleta]|uniref:Alpha-galactosidase n=1 Tax=Capitella teleta TaxID=283909 RepID=R7V6U3_CAPTE|nr:hypothetical protein CAPTEDRAFT_171260 [Capitella teleta]|eukprot:ELU11490.1 hypothetical protein CAPTEDRAFT_171260 [Capitella teleta]
MIKLCVMIKQSLLLLLLSWNPVSCLDNGVALTPPMGWLSWERFECNTDCDVDKNNCISEWLMKEMADVMVANGYRDAGYAYVALDDCWLAHERDERGQLQADPKRFPSGMKALADYLHQRGMKLGIYEDIGTKTCAGFPGCMGNMQKDANTMAEWGVDMLKFDGCNAHIADYDYGFPAMARYLNSTGRHIVYSCEWPMYKKAQGGTCNYTAIAESCNMFRQLTDIYDSWYSVIGMIEYFGDDPGNFSQVAGPGAWNDPDQVVIGNFGLSHDQERVQMALYAILASPLMVSADFRKIRKSSQDILLNPGVIAINQDPLAIQGKRIRNVMKLSIWTRPVQPVGSYAIAFLYTQESGSPIKASANLTSDLGLTDSRGYLFTEVFENDVIGKFRSTDIFTCFVNPTGVVLVKAEPIRNSH